MRFSTGDLVYSPAYQCWGIVLETWFNEWTAGYNYRVWWEHGEVWIHSEDTPLELFSDFFLTNLAEPDK